MMAFAWVPANAATDAGEETAVEKDTPSSARDMKYVETDPQLMQEGFAGEEEAATRSITKSNAKYAGETLPLEAKELDNTRARVIFNESRGGVSFLLYEQSTGKYKVIFYNAATKECTEDASFSDTYEPYYREDNQTLYFIGESHTSDGAGQYIYTPQVKAVDLTTGQTSEFTLGTFTIENNWYNLICTAGVDSKGRFYLATYEDVLYLYAADGTLLSTCNLDSDIDEFFGFDATNGNFYYQGSENWIYWGYDHDMAALMAGNVSADGTVTLAGKNLMMLYQKYWFTHAEPCRMLNGRYLAALSTFSGEQMAMLDSSQYNISDYTEQETTINITDGSVGVSLLNIANTDAVKAQLHTADSNYPEDESFDVSSRGPRCALSADGKTLIAKTEANTLTMYNINTNKQILQAQTTHEVYDFAMEGDTCVILERDGNQLYLEEIDWSLPDDFSVVAPDSLQAGEIGQITASSDSSLQLTYGYKSSNTAVCSVDKRGQISAWAEGDAVITVTCTEIGLSKEVTVHVTGTELSQSSFDYSFCNTKGTTSTNIHLPWTDGYYGSVTESYLALAGENLVRVEYVNGKIHADTYDQSFNLKSSSVIASELSSFGGFFSGEDAYYIVFGKNNPKESNDAVVFRVVKYDKAWNRIKACSIKGANTYSPFAAGGLSMCERNGMLYIHTCHEMYQSDDGYHHQANCDFKIRESDMTLADSYSEVMNLSEGYVSHSFQQKVCADENTLYRADLGDAYPRGIALTGTQLSDKFKNPNIYGVVVPFPEDGWGNYTGFALGGLGYSDSSYIIAGCGVAGANNDTRNVFVSSSYKDAWTQNATWLTKYPEGSETNVNTPKLVKLNDNQFMLLWEEVKGSSYKTKIVLLGPDGSKASKIYSLKIPLSDCEPIVDQSGCVVWYVTKQSSPAFVRINPYQLAAAETRAKTDSSLFIVQNIAKKTVKLSATKFTYTGKAIKPKATVSGLTAGTDFKVTYKNNVKVGKASAIITAKGSKYTGSVTRTFKINPKGTTISSLKATKKGFTVKWKKQAVQTTGYQIMYATNSKFTKGKKTVTIAKTKTVSKKIKKLKAKKKYYVKIRTYKKLSGVKYYSSWSKVKKVKTK